MNYLKARQRQIDGRWNYTSMNDGEIYAIGYCHAFHEFDNSIPVTEQEKEKHQANSHKYHTIGHATEEEACECYRQYLLDHRLHLNKEMGDQQKKCHICGVWTDQFAEIGINWYPLCPEHNTREVVATLFEAPVEIWSS